MLFFGHVGITTGIVKVCQELVTTRRFGQNKAYADPKSGTTQARKHLLTDNLRDKMRSVDYRFLILGSLLPDIIDKPIWMFTASNFPWNGRGYAHTFLFNFVLLIIGLILSICLGKTWFLTISVGSFFHLIFDQMWRLPVTLWWPLLGPIPRETTAGWLPSLWQALISNPYIYISETIGFIIILYLFLRLLVSHRVIFFLKTGNIDWNVPLASDKAKVTKVT